jgi:uncharacterized membrane protein (UPF0127 family)
MALMLMNESTGGTIASRVELALDRTSRRQGLLGRPCLPFTEALVISPCWMVHTGFMRFAIDVLFVNRHGVVVHVVLNMAPWRMAMSARAHLVIEMAAGAAAQRDINVGDRMTLADTGRERAVTPTSRALPLEVRVC